MIHGAGPTDAVARRWTTQLNENAKMAAFASELPEADHNQVCGWERGRQRGPAVAPSSSRTRTTIRACASAWTSPIEEMERAGAPAVRVGSRGESRLERVLSLVLLGDLVSVYMAALSGVDPTPTEALDRGQGSPRQTLTRSW